MDHVAIMRKSWGLIPKVLDGRKKIESRWSVKRVAPWGKVEIGDRIFFKNSGEPVTAVARISRVVQFENLTPSRVSEILQKYGGDDGISVGDFDEIYLWAKSKKYCTLIFLKNVKSVSAFNINKTGFGSAAAWLVVKNINNIKI